MATPQQIENLHAERQRRNKTISKKDLEEIAARLDVIEKTQQEIFEAVLQTSDILIEKAERESKENEFFEGV